MYMRVFKKCKKIILPLVFVLLSSTQSNAQFTDILKAIIKAADIAVQKAQNATIDLQNAQKALENALSQSELGDIAGWVQKQKDLYQDYFNELWQVKTFITEYKKVSDIIAAQKQLVADYKKAFSLVQKDAHFSPAEQQYIYSVYTGIIDASIKDLDQILSIIQSFTVQMSDEERLKIITTCAASIERDISDIRRFNNQAIQISLQRSKDQTDLSIVRKLYGL